MVQNYKNDRGEKLLKINIPFRTDNHVLVINLQFLYDVIECGLYTANIYTG